MINLHRIWLFTILLILSADSGLLAQLKTQNTFNNPTASDLIGGLAPDFSSVLQLSEQLDDNDSSGILSASHQATYFPSDPNPIKPGILGQFSRYQLQPRTSQALLLSSLRKFI